MISEKKKYLDELFEFLKIASISADPNHKNEVRKAADWIANKLIQAGCENVKIEETKGHPIVYGENFLSKELPTILVYGHYDVQPPDPINLWDSPPFEPIIKKTEIHPDGAIFARGSCDDKGQLYMHVKAFQILKNSNQLKCNVKFLFEGEEEVGSENLENYLNKNKDKLKTDIIIISDTGIGNLKNPKITVGLRGLSYMELKIKGPNRDLHSGLYGGSIANPINVLNKIIASLHDKNNKITIPGFYEDVLELSKKDREEIIFSESDEKKFRESLDISSTHGELEYNTEERRSIRPTLDVNGIWGGYIGEGSKTVIPSTAHAKISMRLVPNQKWKKISSIFKKHIEKIAPKEVEVEVKTHHGGEPYLTPINSLGFRAAEKAYQESFGVKPKAKRDGGSIPIVPMFEKILKCKTILMGFGLDSDAIHSPNEHFGIKNFYKGIETIILFYKYFSSSTLKNK